MEKASLAIAAAALAATLVLQACSHVSPGRGLWAAADFPDSRQAVPAEPAPGAASRALPGDWLAYGGTAVPARFVRVRAGRPLGRGSPSYFWPAGDYEVLGEAHDGLNPWSRLLIVSDTSTEGRRMASTDPRIFPLSENGQFEISFSSSRRPESQFGRVSYPCGDFLGGWGGFIDLRQDLVRGFLPDPKGRTKYLQYLGRDGNAVRARLVRMDGRRIAFSREVALKPDSDGICRIGGAELKILGFEGEEMRFIPIRGLD